MPEIVEKLKAALADRYLIERELGRGGMATVYLAQDIRHKRSVALKVLHPALAQTLGPERFQREIELAARLQHPHILTVHDSGKAAGQLWFTMPFVEGESLRDRLRREKQLPVEDAIRIATETARALDHAHRHGVVHRDIKPENILLTRDGDTLVADFGIARALAAGAGGADDRLTETGMAIGTPAYMSPEQASGGEVDARTDVYALGCMLYEMLAGEPPFTGLTPQAVFAKRLSGEVPQLRRLRPAVSDHIGRAVAKALAPLAADRFQTAAEFARALATGDGSEQGDTAAAAVGLQHRRKVSIAAFALGLLALGALGLLLWSRSARLMPGAAALRDPPGTDTVSNTLQPSLPVQPSVAVLPFANLSPDPANEYFSDGMTEELITALSQVEGLRVAARTSAFVFKGMNADIREVGTKLRVSTVLEGSVRRAGRRLRVTAKLINVADGYHLWSEEYDRELKDVFAVQDDLARAIVGALRGHLLPGPTAAPIVEAGTADPEAHDLYLQGRFFWNQRTPESLRTAIRYFERAIARDSGYADAYAALADAYVLFPNYAVAPPSESYPKAKAAAVRALALDSSLGSAHVALGLIQQSYEWNWRGAEQSFRRALALNPGYAPAHQQYGEFLSALGRHPEALAHADSAVDLDPLSSIIRSDKGGDLIRARRYDAAIAELREAIDLNPSFAPAHNYLGWAYLAKGMYTEAVAELDTAVRLSGRRAGIGRLAYAYGLSGQRDSAVQIIRELTDRSRHEYLPALQFALAYAGLGDRDQAIAWVDKGAAMREPFTSGPLVDPLFDPLRSDPRFARLRARMGLPP